MLNNLADIHLRWLCIKKATNVFDGTSTHHLSVVPEDETQLGNFIDLHERRGKRLCHLVKVVCPERKCWRRAQVAWATPLR